MDLSAQYKSFSFDPIKNDIFFESCKYELVQFDNLVTKNFVLDQTLAHIKFNILVDFAPTILLKPLIHDDILSRQMTHLPANFKYVCLFDAWAQLM